MEINIKEFIDRYGSLIEPDMFLQLVKLCDAGAKLTLIDNAVVSALERQLQERKSKKDRQQ